MTEARYTRGLGLRRGIGSIISEERRTGQENNTVSRYYHYDGIGTVTGLSNALGYLTESFSYDAFGNMLGCGMNSGTLQQEATGSRPRNRIPRAGWSTSPQDTTTPHRPLHHPPTPHLGA